MFSVNQLLASRSLQIASGLALAVLWGSFAIDHVDAFQNSGSPSFIFFAVAETLIAAFFVLRRPTRSISTRPVEWIAAVVGTFLPLLLRPAPVVLVPAAEFGLMLGSCLQMFGVISLNRSFGIVPAVREIKAGGMYRFVRHPIYLSYVISFSSYLLISYSATNLLIVLAEVVFLVLRIHFEELQLRDTPEYRAYQKDVRWRLLPFVY